MNEPGVNGGDHVNLRDARDGAIAGAVGSAVLNAVTYVDIASRARPASQTPQETVRRLADIAHVPLGPEDRAANRRAGLGPLLGYVMGIGVGAVYGALVADRAVPTSVATLLLGTGAMVGSDGPMTVLGVTDPRRWSGGDWLSDIIPHLAYGLAAAATWQRLRGTR